MPEINNIRVKDILEKIAIRSMLTEAAAFEIIRDCMVPPLWLDFISQKMMEAANKGESVPLIKIEVHSLMAQISMAGGLENYKSMKGLK